MTITTDLFTYLPGLQVSPNEILESELFCQQVLQAQFPDTDWRQGTGVTDMVIRPSATLLALVNKALIYYFSQNTIANITNDTSTEIVDSLLSNWFIQRNQGSASVINARLYFATAKNTVLNTSTYFSPDNILKFYPSGALTFTSNQMSLDIASNSWYIDVDLVAEVAGSGYDLSSGSLLYFTTFDTYFLRAEINYLSQTAVSSESNTDFVARTGNSISTRNLINTPSISSNLINQFSYISEVYSAGLGDAEMIRDQVQVQPPTLTSPIWIHTGGMVDVYCRVPLTTETIQFTTDSTGKVLVTGANYKIARSALSGGPDVDTSIVSTGTTLAGSNQVIMDSDLMGVIVGSLLSIEGAGPGGSTFNATVTVITGLTYTLDGNASRSATNTTVGFGYQVTNLNFGQASGVTITSGSSVLDTFSYSPFALDSFDGLTVTSAVGVATATRPNHGLTVGRYVTITGADQANYNGNFKVETVSKDSFTYLISGTPASPASGTISLYYAIPNYDVGFSDRQTLSYDFGVGQANKTVTFNLYYFQGLDGIQNYLSSTANKVLSADLLARGFNLCLLDIAIVGYNGNTPSSATALTLAQKYLASLAPGQVFVMSDLLSTLYAGGITTIQTPVTINYNVYTRDLVGPIYGTIVDTYNPHDSTNVFIVNTITTTSENV